MASIFLTPFLLFFVVPKRVEDILQFIADFTVNVDGVGHVCSFSTFDFQSHGNANYGSPYNATRSRRSCQGKMEKSFLSFQSNYPSWEPSPQGKQFIANLRTFKDQNLQGRGIRNAYAPPRMVPRNQSLRGRGNRHNVATDVPPRFNCGSLWLIDEEPWTHPYFLDWYYTSKYVSSTNPMRENPTQPFEDSEHQPGDLWMPSDWAHNDARDDEEFWSQRYEDRLGSHLGASTSMPAFRDSVFQHHDSTNLGHPTQSHWWARTDSHGAHLQTSFPEPPNFNQYHLDNHYENFSERSLDEQEEHFQWRSFRGLSKTTYADVDLEAGGSVNLHFDDIYSRPPESPTVYREPTSL